MKKKCDNCSAKNKRVKSFIVWGKRLDLCEYCEKIVFRLKVDEKKAQSASH